MYCGESTVDKEKSVCIAGIYRTRRGIDNGNEKNSQFVHLLVHQAAMFAKDINAKHVKIDSTEYASLTEPSNEWQDTFE